ncbi:hypothetical protein FXO38_23353 [Capsicum annuum]|nr:hypothetical protein FXO38_23353 [Capsicum annuum]
MINVYQLFNGIKKWFDGNCDIVLDCPIIRRDLKNVLKSHFKAYLDWEADMALPDVPNLYSNTDAIIVRNFREVYSRGRPHINRNRFLHQYTFHGDVGDGDPNTMMYMKRYKAVKVGVAVEDRVIEIVEEVGCVVVEEVEAMIQT